ncbi:hypothetical protein V500_01932 [Pseudogymnoascus sp. VKM F-4518 (FW-2643)]|nr:hypothetical protein V500_01932 [Pseudogymnoascus sp. VKM F-4518 (FW-2643)]
MTISEPFQSLTTKEKLYAHHLSRAAWAGTNIILHQVSPEAPEIFALIVELYKSCAGNWLSLLDQDGLKNIPFAEAEESLKQFLFYAATFMSNIGNYYASDQKFVPDISLSFLTALSAVSAPVTDLSKSCGAALLSPTPTHLGYPSKVAQSAYYPGDVQITEEEIEAVAPFLVEAKIRPRNTRLAKYLDPDTGKHVFEILQASAEKPYEKRLLGHLESGEEVRTSMGDHATELENICFHLSQAKEATGSSLQKEYLEYYIQFFKTGDAHLFDNSQRVWMKDKQPRIETFFGFNHKYRDPAGARAEFQGVVALLDAEDSKELNQLQRDAQSYVSTLPWAKGATDGSANGPFEMSVFQAPDFNAVYALSYCATNIFLGLSMPAFCDNWKDYAWKNMVVKNRDQALGIDELSQGEPAYFIEESEKETYLKHIDQSVTFKIALHEVFGHGTGKLLSETSEGEYNFDIAEPPLNPLTGKPITSWYKIGERTSSVFGDMDMSIEESLGYTDDSAITANDLIYNLYLSFGQLGITALDSYQPEDTKWTQAHDRARFGIMRLLLTTNKIMSLTWHDPDTVSISIDRTKIATDAKAAIADLMMKLHIYRCTADGAAAQKLYKELTQVDEEWLRVRELVVRKVREEPPRIFVQGNTVEKEGEVEVRDYDTTPEGVIRSWVDRATWV